MSDNKNKGDLTNKRMIDILRLIKEDIRNSKQTMNDISERGGTTINKVYGKNIANTFG